MFGQPHFCKLQPQKFTNNLKGKRNHHFLVHPDHGNQFDGEFGDRPTPLWIGLNPAADHYLLITQAFQSNSILDLQCSHTVLTLHDQLSKVAIV